MEGVALETLGFISLFDRDGEAVLRRRLTRERKREKRKEERIVK